jgi:hypothetical protein
MLSKTMMTTCLMFPFAEFNWQPPVAGGGAGAGIGAFAGGAAAAHAGATAQDAMSAVAMAASVRRRQLTGFFVHGIFRVHWAEMRYKFAEASLDIFELAD